MAKHTFAIIGATGNIGRVLTEELLKKGHKVHAIGRDKNKLQELKVKGAETFSVALDNATTLTEALKGCDAVFSFIPPTATGDFGMYQDKVGESILKSILNAKIYHVLNLSSVGANLPDGTGPVKGLYRHEKRLNSVQGLNVLHLRAGYFMENLLMLIPIIKATGEAKGLLKPDLPVSMVATRDIGLKAAEFLEQLNFAGQSFFDFAGPQEITIAQVSTTLGKAIGKSDLKYAQLPPVDAEKWMLTNGLKPDFAKSMLEMYQSFNNGKMVFTQKLTSEHKGKTTIEEFSKIFEQKYNSKTTEQVAHSHS
jgi:uncharacterized protein YbjT (DUF2867 family)